MFIVVTLLDLMINIRAELISKNHATLQYAHYLIYFFEKYLLVNKIINLTKLI